jgi:hypothetical protein
VFFVRSAEMGNIRRILVALRGFSSDEYAMDWVTALARYTGAHMTLMPIFVSSVGHFGQTLNGNHPALAAMADCLRRFQVRDTLANLKLRQGNPVQQVADEFEQGDYDLLVIAAEGVGEFVGRVLAEVNRRPRCTQRPMLVLKPTYS